jgi:hypothetical protein
VQLDGMSLTITYTVPASGGALAGATGCLVQSPYYSATSNAGAAADHSPAYNGACALLGVSDDNHGGSFPRMLTVWGTVYAPSDVLDVPVDIMTESVFNRGVVARTLMLGYRLENNAPVPVVTTPTAGVLANNRNITITAKVPGTTTSVTAQVVFCDADGTQCAGGVGHYRIKSWTVSR